MKPRFANRFLLGAFGLSILAHVFFALAARNIPRAEAAPEPTPGRLEVIHIIVPTPAPTPTPPPVREPERPATRTQAAPRIHVDVPRSTSSNIGAHIEPQVMATSGTDVPGDDPYAQATAPAIPPRPACSIPDAPARTIDAAMPETPDGIAGLPATAEVQVTLDASGHVTDVRIYRSADDPQLDRAALAAARGSTYAPALVDCSPAGGSYLFRVEFQS